MSSQIRYASPLGEMLLAAHHGALVGAWFVDQKYFPSDQAGSDVSDDLGLLGEAAGQLDAYFAGRLQRFDLPLRPRGSPYQTAVWAAIAAVAYGQTITYGELARHCGMSGSPRAAGRATGRNPLGIIVPCHRIIGANGHLTGYAGGLERKRKLLALEAQPNCDLLRNSNRLPAVA